MRGGRRKAREDALQILYQLDVNLGLTAPHALTHFKDHFAKEKATDEFTQRLVMGVAENLSAIDSLVEKTSEHWRTERMAVVDRNILRLGAFELYYCDDIPSTVSINEMIEVAKHFGSESSAAFINGILDKLKAGLNRPAKAP